MFVSKMKLDIKNSSVRQALNNAQDMHRNIQRLYAGAREDAQVLYRIVRRRDAIYLYIQSKNPPNVEKLPGNGMTLIDMANIDHRVASYKKGDQLRFNLLVYPSKKVTCGEKNSRRVSLGSVEERMQWLSDKLSRNGMRIISAAEKGKESVRFRKQSGEYTLNGYQYYGLLEITDSAAFVQGLIQGVGPEKAYGYGMVFVI